MTPLHSTSVTAVIPAYNERGRLRNVLAVVRQVPDFREIIVVDDGSTDGTELDVQEFTSLDARIHYLRLAENQGKTRAMQAGVEAAQGELIVFLDADLYQMTPETVRSLIQPVRDGQAEMTVGVFRGGKWYTDMSQRVGPWLSGQRCLPRSLFNMVPLDQVNGYGIETAFTIIAIQRHWRVKHVPLWGAYHESSETRRGSLFYGLRWKGRMFQQIWQTFLALWLFSSANKNKLRSIRRIFLSGLVVLALALISLSLFYNRSQASAHIHMEDLGVFDLENAQRLLVVAPHPDDETLGAGGAIQAALAKGMQVRVLVFTNGDAQISAAITLQKDLAPQAKDFIRDGEIRQQESLNALQVLGVPAGQVDYLGFPDRQVDRLWLDDWQQSCPLRAEFTHTTQVPYPDAYQPGAEYCGSAVVESVKKVLADYQPDLILLPQVNDDHPDHRAASQFTLLAAAELSAQDPAYRPALWGYIVHFGKYPLSRGWRLNKSLLPPISLNTQGNRWARLDLTPAQENRKVQAIRAYPSQMRLMKSFMEGFARQDEIFQKINLLDFTQDLINTGEIRQESALDLTNLTVPDKETSRKFMLPGTDLIDLQVIEFENHLLLTAETQGAILEDFQYLFHFKFPDGSTRTCSLGQDGLRLGSARYTCSLDISALPRPTVIGFEAEIDKKFNRSYTTTFDRSGWHFLILR